MQRARGPSAVVLSGMQGEQQDRQEHNLGQQEPERRAQHSLAFTTQPTAAAHAFAARRAPRTSTPLSRVYVLPRCHHTRPGGRRRGRAEGSIGISRVTCNGSADKGRPHYGAKHPTSRTRAARAHAGRPPQDAHGRPTVTFLAGDARVTPTLLTRNHCHEDELEEVAARQLLEAPHLDRAPHQNRHLLPIRRALPGRLAAIAAGGGASGVAGGGAVGILCTAGPAVGAARHLVVARGRRVAPSRASAGALQRRRGAAAALRPFAVRPGRCERVPQLTHGGVAGVAREGGAGLAHCGVKHKVWGAAGRNVGQRIV